jgi:D-sedoheptulose 7-phosphate isomerase
MKYQGLIKRRIEDSIDLKMRILNDNDLLLALEQACHYCLNSFTQGGKIIFAGNGGSFADAQHLTAEFISRFKFERVPMPAITLGTNNSLVSAIGNDYGFEQIFARELIALSEDIDFFMPISTSGNSLNLLIASQAALEKGMHVMGWTGQSGGKLSEICDCLKVPSNKTERIQECHILLGHILCEIVEQSLFIK